MAGILETLVEWLVSVSQWFNGWDITLLVPALIILTVIAGVTGRAGGHRAETMDATRLGNGDRHPRPDRGRDHLDHHRPLPAGRRHGHAHPERAPTQAAVCYRISAEDERAWRRWTLSGKVTAIRQSTLDRRPSYACPSDGAARRMNSPMSGTVKATLPCSGE